MSRELMWLRIARSVGLTKPQARVVLETVLDTIIEQLKGPKRQFKLVGFGSFRASTTEGRTFRNPHTGETERTAPGGVVKFQAHDPLKDELYAALAPPPPPPPAKKPKKRKTAKKTAKPRAKAPPKAKRAVAHSTA